MNDSRSSILLSSEEIRDLMETVHRLKAAARHVRADVGTVLAETTDLFLEHKDPDGDPAMDLDVLIHRLETHLSRALSTHFNKAST